MTRKVAEAQIRPDHVGVYIRWSTEDQGEGTTLAVQRDACAAYVRSQGWQVPSDLVFVDDGYSGGTLDRPAMAALRKAVQTGRVDCVVCFKLDRLSRAVVDTVRLVLDEWDGLCHFKSAREPIDTATQAGKLFFYQLAQYAEWERDVIRDRTYSGKLRRAEAGGHQGPPAFGYLLVPDPQNPKRSVRVPNEQEAQHVRAAFGQAALGTGCYAIAKGLNQAGSRTRTGNLWTPSSVAYMLRNPLYKGDAVFARRQVNPRRRRRPGEPVRVINPQPTTVHLERLAIVAPEQWQAAQRGGGATHRGDGRALRPQVRDRAPRCLLSGLLDSRCLRPRGVPYPMVAQKKPGGRGYEYRCFGYHDGSHKGCLSRTVDVAQLDRQVEQAFLARYGSPEKRQHLEELMSQQQLGDDREQLASRRRLLSEQVRRSRAQGDRLDKDYLDGALAAGEYQRLAAKVRNDAATAQAQLQRLAEAEGESEAVHGRLAAMMEQLGDADRWHSLSLQRRHQVLQLVVDRICVWRRRREVQVEVRWKYDHPAAVAAGEPRPAEPDAPNASAAILRVLAGRPQTPEGGCTVADLALATGFSRPSIHRCVYRMWTRDQLARTLVGQPGAYVYFLNTPRASPEACVFR